jgi:hypothetical protein
MTTVQVGFRENRDRQALAVATLLLRVHQIRTLLEAKLS